MEQVYNKTKDCSGCRACENICPRNAIKIICDEKGFKYPNINEKDCINCNSCKKVCPMLSEIEKMEQIKIYASKNKNEEIRNTSSSGGVFSSLAEYIINQNGVVFGAIFDNEFKVVHAKASNLEELQKIRTSKYVQSDLKNIYKQVKEELKNGKKVLFSGTPCQVAGIKNYIGENGNLYLIDIVCHGVPSPKIFEDYKAYLEEKYNSKIVDINFRYKIDNKIQKIKVEFENGNRYISSFNENDYMYKLFLNDLILRDSCYECKFKNINRATDISLADFWGIEKTNKKDFDDQKGVSLILVNTKKGYELLKNIENKLDLKEANREECMPYNCFGALNRNNNINIIWKEYFKNGFIYIAERYCK